MCFPISLRFLKKRVVGNAFPLLFGLCLVLGAAVFFSGCKTDEEDDTGNLVGKWENVYHDPNGAYPDFTTIIEITGETVVYTGSYEATIANEPDFETSYGVLILKFTKYATDYDGNPVATHANVGKFGALYWKDLTDSSVSLADAYKDYVHQLVDTLDTAKTTFTNDKIGDYIDWSGTSPYNKK
ncbi:MAG: hypothetical protein LBL76_03825 [Treponema sp.]|jgi:hypothetical protein|nr:hypothetical protein [Treponema sp.]